MTDYIADYRTWLQEEKHASDNTLSSYLRDINQFKTWLLGAGSPDLRRVKKDTINEYMLYLSGAGKSPATITRCTASLKSFYAYMLGRGAVKTNPAKNIAALKVERKCPEILTSKEVELFLEQPKCVDEKGYRDHAMLELLYHGYPRLRADRARRGGCEPRGRLHPLPQQDARAHHPALPHRDQGTEGLHN